MLPSVNDQVSGVIGRTSDEAWETGNPGVMPMEYMSCPAGLVFGKQTLQIQEM